MPERSKPSIEMFVAKWTVPQIWQALTAASVILIFRRLAVDMGTAEHGEYLDKAWAELEQAMEPDYHPKRVRGKKRHA